MIINDDSDMLDKNTISQRPTYPNTRTPRPTKAKKTKKPKPTKGPKPTKKPKPTKGPKPTKKPRPTKAPKPTRPGAAPTMASNMECYTVTDYRGSGSYDNGEHQDVTCSDDDALTGCITFNNQDGNGHNEGMYGAYFVQDYYDPKYFYCRSWSKFSSGAVGIYGRCCKSTSAKAVLKSQTPGYGAWDKYDTTCNMAEQCDTNADSVMTGCSPVYMNPGYTGGYAHK